MSARQAGPLVTAARRARSGTGTTVARRRSVAGAQARIGGRVIWNEVNIEIASRDSSPRSSDRTARARRRCCGCCSESCRSRAASASVLGRRPGAHKRQIGYLPQRRHFEPGTRIRGIDLVRLGLDGARWGLPLRRAGGERIERVLELVGAGAYARRPIGSLSGGEQQRLLIAQALVSEPRAARPRRAAGQPRPAQPERRRGAAGADLPRAGGDRAARRARRQPAARPTSIGSSTSAPEERSSAARGR